MSTPSSKDSSSFSYSTPSPRKHHKRDRQHHKHGKNGSSSVQDEEFQHCNIPTNVDGPIRKVYLIRHGESQGQRASRQERKTSERLVDCGLTRNGIEQAKLIPFLLPPNEPIQLVVTSPLTRAIHTALLAFPTRDNDEGPAIPIWMGYDLREIGSSIPENRPRKFKDIWRDLSVDPTTLARVDFHKLSSEPAASSFAGPWPKGHDTPPKVVRRDRIRQVMRRLAHELPDSVTTVAIVCHYNVIRTLLSDPYQPSTTVHPVNAQPLECQLYPNGHLEFVKAIGDEVDETDVKQDEKMVVTS